MSRLSDAVTQAWYQNKKWVWCLLPLTLLFGLVSTLRRLGYQKGFFKQVEVDVPVIIIGNISVGGTGKSPLTGYLVSELKRRGYKPGIVSRGYGGKSDSYPVVVDTASFAEVVGDEPLMLHQMTQCPVVVDPVRSRAASKLSQEFGCNVILCDDGLQHYALNRDIEICVIDGDRKLGNGFLLPAGPLREPSNRLSSVDYVVINGERGLENPFSSYLSDDSVFFMSLKPSHLINVFTGQTLEIDNLKGMSIHALAGIGNPERFFSALSGLGANVTPHSFADHHGFIKTDFDFNDNKPVIMTHKDAVKCQSLYKDSTPANLWYLPVTAELDQSFLDQLTTKLGLLS